MEKEIQRVRYYVWCVGGVFILIEQGKVDCSLLMSYVEVEVG